jgi:hypothetical protein
MWRRGLFISTFVVLLVVSIPVTTGQDEPTIVVALTPFEGNPIVLLGEDSPQYFQSDEPRVIFHDGMFHMFFSGIPAPDAPVEIGYAMSPDGLVWATYAGNPILTTDQVGADSIASKVVFYDGTQWVLLFNPGARGGHLTDHYLRATAPAPTGPWSVDANPVLEAGRATSWDTGDIVVHSVTSVDSNFVLHYSSSATASFVGMATSPDGIAWSKYDDPATIGMRFARSDPVFTATGDRTWDAFISWPMIRWGAQGFEMFYEGCLFFPASSCNIGYAYSLDGLAWTRLSEPVLTFDSPDSMNTFDIVETIPRSVVVVDDTYFLYYTEMSIDDRWINVATGTVTWDEAP